MIFSSSWTRPNNIRNWLVGWVARLPARVQTKLLAAFLSIVGLLIVLGAVGLQVLSGVNEQTNELIRQQRKIAAYHQVQHDTTSQLYSISTALLLQEDRMLDAALRQLRQFGYDLDRMEFVARDEAELLAQVRQDYDRLTAEVTRVVDLIRTGRTDEARDDSTGADHASGGPPGTADEPAGQHRRGRHGGRDRDDRAGLRDLPGRRRSRLPSAVSCWRSASDTSSHGR